MSVCISCLEIMLDSEARIDRVCIRCKKKGVRSDPVNHFAAIGKRMPRRKFATAPMPWQVADAYARVQSGE